MAVVNWHGTDRTSSEAFQVTGLPEVKDIEHLSQDIKSLLQNFKQELKKLYGPNLINLILYGSYARHDETAASDIDVLVILEKECSPAEEILRMGDAKIKILMDYGELVSIVPVSENDFLHRDSPLLNNIRQEGIVVWAVFLNTYYVQPKN